MLEVFRNFFAFCACHILHSTNDAIESKTFTTDYLLSSRLNKFDLQLNKNSKINGLLNNRTVHVIFEFYGTCGTCSTQQFVSLYAVSNTGCFKLNFAF